jgi:hypothetical protein
MIVEAYVLTYPAADREPELPGRQQFPGHDWRVRGQYDFRGAGGLTGAGTGRQCAQAGLGTHSQHGSAGWTTRQGQNHRKSSINMPVIN